MMGDGELVDGLGFIVVFDFAGVIEINRYKDWKDIRLFLEVESMSLEGRLIFFYVFFGMFCILKIMCKNYFLI